MTDRKHANPARDQHDAIYVSGINMYCELDHTILLLFLLNYQSTKRFQEFNSIVMKKIVAVVISSFLVVTFLACSKSSDGDGGTLPPPDPGSTGEVTAVLSFSNGITHNLSATGNYTLFHKLIDTHYHDTLLSITGSLAGNYGSLTIRLTNIDGPGTYAFVTNQMGGSDEGYPQCEFTGNATDESYSTMQIRTNPGSITIETLTSNYVSGYFNAELTNWYPGRPTARTDLTISNGRFAGHFTTSSY